MRNPFLSILQQQASQQTSQQASQPSQVKPASETSLESSPGKEEEESIPPASRFFFKITAAWMNPPLPGIAPRLPALPLPLRPPPPPCRFLPFWALSLGALRSHRFGGIFWRCPPPPLSLFPIGLRSVVRGRFPSVPPTPPLSGLRHTLTFMVQRAVWLSKSFPRATRQ